VARTVETVGGPVFRLKAKVHTACLFFPIRPFDPAIPYKIALQYRTVRGRQARLCFWRDGPQTCAALPVLRRSGEWRTLSTVIEPDRRATGARLFVYADGGGRGTITEYRALSAAPLLSAAAIGVRPAAALPELTYRRLSSAKFRVRVSGASEPFLLVVTEGFDRGWVIERSGRNDPAPRHLKVNGYANGWIVPWTGSYDLTVEYAPERYARLARRFDLAVIPLLVVLALGRRAFDRRRASST
jgi:hypothetical protein